ncbi:MAG TPA: hypothetical protein VFQ45_19160 [Longimicrobium sp.]|nr:hypothetical protein [Longimicrobium sp.]
MVERGDATWTDPIVEETRRMREKLLAKFDGDSEALAEYLREIERQHQDRIVSYPPRSARETLPPVR